jgi:hypothetical protein
MEPLFVSDAPDASASVALLSTNVADELIDELAATVRVPLDTVSVSPVTEMLLTVALPTRVT